MKKRSKAVIQKVTDKLNYYEKHKLTNVKYAMKKLRTEYLKVRNKYLDCLELIIE